MRSDLTLEQLAVQIGERAESKADFITDTRSLDVEWLPDEKRFNVNMEGGSSYAVTDHTHRQIADHQGIPWAYYDRLMRDEPDMLEFNVNQWLVRKPTSRMVRTLNGNARAYLSDRYARMDDDVFAEVVLSAVSDIPGAEVVSTAITEERTYIKFVSRRLEREVKVGDPIQFGLSFRNSEIGMGKLGGALMALRLACLNGATFPEEEYSATHLGGKLGSGENIYALDTVNADAKATILKLRDFTRELLTEKRIDAVVAKMKALTGIPINSPVAAVERLAKTHRFTDVERGSILTHLIKGGQLSMWGLMNAVTAHAQDPELSYTRATELETIGGKMLSLPTQEYRELSQAA